MISLPVQLARLYGQAPSAGLATLTTPVASAPASQNPLRSGWIVLLLGILVFGWVASS
jgi:hypothetical protein